MTHRNEVDQLWMQVYTKYFSPRAGQLHFGQQVFFHFLKNVCPNRAKNDITTLKKKKKKNENNDDDKKQQV